MKEKGASVVSDNDNYHRDHAEGAMGTMHVSIECAGTISIPLHAVASREREMEQTALKLSIAPERWSGSLLYNEWKALEHRNKNVDITLHPETQTSKEWSDILPCIETYYTTGKLLIPGSARGYEILAAVEYFGILYQPDQCHFANYEVYKRIQLWSKYLCHRATLAAWVHRQLDVSEFQKFAFGTGTGGSMELGTRALAHLGDKKVAPGNTMSMAEIAYNLFNSSEVAPGESSSDSESPEEGTAAEMREDFASYLESNVGGTVLFSVKPVTFYKDAPPVNSLDSSIEASSITPKLQVVNRAVLFIDISMDSKLKEDQEMQLLIVKQARSKSDLSAPVDELVEEELAAGRLEELVEEVDHRNMLTAKRNLKVTFETSPTSVLEEQNTFVYESLAERIEEQNMAMGIRSTASEQSSVALNAPDDELSPPPRSSSVKRKKKKPVFELPDKLLEDPKMLPRQVVKSPADLKGIVPLAPISLIRATTNDQPSVTSALTGPFYLDDDGNVRDAFERSADPNKDGDDDTRAQAKRHEWIQGALLNEGIDQRIQELLSEGEGSSDSSEEAGLDPWDWITGLAVCEFSRSMLESMEQYASEISGARKSADGAPNAAVSEKAPETQVADIEPPSKGPVAPAIVKSPVSEDTGIYERIVPAAASSEIQPARRSPSRVRDRMLAVLQKIRAHEGQSRQDEAHGIEQYQQDSGGDGTREDGAKSQLSDQMSSESPRGVVTGVTDCLTNMHMPDRTENSSRKSMEAADEGKKVKFTDQTTSIESSRGVVQRVTGCLVNIHKSDRSDIPGSGSMEAACEELAKVPSKSFAVAAPSDDSPKRKTRGLKGLFRRR